MMTFGIFHPNFPMFLRSNPRKVVSTELSLEEMAVEHKRYFTSKMLGFWAYSAVGFFFREHIREYEFRAHMCTNNLISGAVAWILYPLMMSYLVLDPIELSTPSQLFRNVPETTELCWLATQCARFMTGLDKELIMGNCMALWTGEIIWGVSFHSQCHPSLKTTTTGSGSR